MFGTRELLPGKKRFLEINETWRLIQPFYSDFYGKDLKLAQLS